MKAKDEHIVSHFSAISATVLLFVVLLIASNCSAQSIIVRIDIYGLKKTQKEIVLQQIPFKEGSAINPSQIPQLTDRITANLTQLNLFNQIEVVIDELPDENGHRIFVQVVEKWFVWPIPFVEYSDRNVRQWGNLDFDPSRVNYGLYLFLYNIGGVKRDLKLSLITGYTNNIGMQHSSPIWGKISKWRTESSLHFSSNHEIWSSTRRNKLQFSELDVKKFRASYGVSYYPNVNAKIGLRYEAGQTQGSSGQFSQLYYLGLGNTKLEQHALQLTFQIEKRDNNYFPNQGHYLNVSTTQLTTNRKNHIMDVAFDISKYHMLNEKISGYVNYHLRLRKSNGNLPYTLNRAMGYEHTLRSYEQYVVDGGSYFLGRHGLRYQLSGGTFRAPFIPLKAYKSVVHDVYLGAFYDHGFVERTSGSIIPDDDISNDLPSTYMFGYGIGLEAVFYYDKVVRIEYSRNRQGETGLNLHFKQAI